MQYAERTQKALQVINRVIATNKGQEILIARLEVTIMEQFGLGSAFVKKQLTNAAELGLIEYYSYKPYFKVL